MKTDLELQEKTTVSKKIGVAALVGLSALLIASLGFVLLSKQKPAAAQVQTLTIAIKAPAYTLADSASADNPGKIIQVEQASTLQEVGKPKLPVVQKIVLLPPGAKVQRVQWRPTHQKQEQLDKPLVPVQSTDVPQPFPKNPGADPQALTVPTLVRPDSATYASNAQYPANQITKTVQDQWGPYNVEVVDLSLFQYAPVSQALIVNDEGNVLISYLPSKQQIDRRRFRPTILAEAQQRLLNPEMLPTWYGDVGSQSPTLPAVVQPIDLAIIRPDFLWHKLGNEPSAHAIYATDASHVWLVSKFHEFNDGFNIAYYNGVSWSTDFPQGVPATNLVAMDGETSGTVIAVGDAPSYGSVLAVHRPGGVPTGFQPYVPLPTHNISSQANHLLAVDVMGPTTAWAVGTYNGDTHGLILRADPSASPTFSSWQQIDVFGNTQPLRAVYGADANHVWVAGDNGTIYFYNGTSWVSQTSGVTARLNDLSGTGPSDVWAVGDAGTILHFNGSVWQDMTATNPDYRYGSPRNLTEVQAIDVQNVWIAGQGPLMHWHSPSQSWIPGYFVRSDAIWRYGDDWNFDVRDLFALDANHIYLTRHGDLFLSDNSSTYLDNYMAYRTAQGYQIETKTLGEIWGAYRGQYNGRDDELMTVRAYLQDRYEHRGLKYVMIVGSQDLIVSGTSEGFGSDRYYRDLEGVGGADGTNELFVSRIPRDDASELRTYLDSVPAFEVRTDPYRSHALLTSATGYYGVGLCGISSELMELLHREVLTPRGFSTRTIYADYGIVSVGPPEVTIEDQVRQYWNIDHPYVVSMHGHGAPGLVDHSLRFDDFDLFDPAFPAHIVIPESCSTAAPEYYNNFSYGLGRGAMSVVGATMQTYCGFDPGLPGYVRRLLDDQQTPAESFGYTLWHDSGMTVYADPLLTASPQPIIFQSPISESAYRAVSNIDIVGSVLGAGFSSYTIDWGAGANPTIWSATGITLNTPNQKKVDALLGTWNVSGITTAGQYTLRITGVYNGQPKSHQITLTIDNQVCSDATAPQQCSTTKPRFCENGQLQNRCGTCGCSNVGDTCQQDGSCFAGCTDGTPQRACSSTVGFYCSATSTLIPLAQQCASSDGAAHTNDDCNYCGVASGTYCRNDGICSTPEAGRGLLGNYYQGENFDTLVHADVPDPVIDFGGGFTAGSYFQDVLRRSDRANTSGATSVRWDGFVNVPTASSITYYLTCRHRCKLFIEDLSIPKISVSGFGDSIPLAPGIGWHPIRIEFQKDAGIAPQPGLQLGWKVNGQSYSLEFPMGASSPIPVSYIIPHSALAPTVPDTQAPTVPNLHHVTVTAIRKPGNTGIVLAASFAKVQQTPDDSGGGGGVKPKFIPLAWDASTDSGSGVAGYKLYFCFEALAGCTPSSVINVGNVTTYTATAAVLNMNYAYEVTAYDRAGNESGRSNRETVTIFQ